MRLFFTFLSGFIFSLGLLISGMANPAKVLGFLDIAGLWDPSLIFVMIGAISTSFFAFQYAKHRSHTLLGEPINMSSSQEIDKKLILGGILFGIGWGLIGLCPGPAIVAIGTGNLYALYFSIAVVIGMLIYQKLQIIMSKIKRKIH